MLAVGDRLPSVRQISTSRGVSVSTVFEAYYLLEARGLIRGGRFVNGLAGEQFALPEAIPLLREVRRHANDGAFVCVGGTDPLNLAGTLLVGERVPAVAGNRILFRDGIVVATLVAGAFWFEASVEANPAEREQARSWLTRRF